MPSKDFSETIFNKLGEFIESQERYYDLTDIMMPSKFAKGAIHVIDRLKGVIDKIKTEIELERGKHD
jgi:hypothetical protein